MFKGKVPLIFALALGLLSALLFWAHIKEREEEIRKGWNTTKIVVASKDVTEGDVIDLGGVAQREIPEKFVTESVLTPENINFVVGQKVAVPLKRGDPILWSHFQSSAGFERLSTVVQKRGRA